MCWFHGWSVMVDALCDATMAAQLDAMREGSVSSVELTQAFLSRARASNPSLNAWVALHDDVALAAARHADKSRADGNDGLLLGVPVGIKDIFCWKGQPTQCSSRILEGFEAPYESEVVRRLQAAGAVILGRQNMDEFAMGSTTETSVHGPSRNPWNLAYSPGGSSGGSAAAVAARTCSGAIGTDTGGSVRQPAAFCGVVGLKPTWGRVSRYGMVAFASSLDQAGTLGQTTADCARLLQAIAGHDARDATCSRADVPNYTMLAERAARNGLQGVRIGIPSEYFGAGLHDDVRAAVDGSLVTMRDAGAVLVPIELPHTTYAVATYYLICTAEASSNLARYDGIRFGRRVPRSTLDATYRATRGEGFGDEVKRRIMLGTFVLSEGYYDQFYGRAGRVRTLIRRDFERAFESVDVIATPTVPRTAIGLGELVDDCLGMYLTDVCTTGANLAGIPASSVPCGLDSSGLPIGLQLMAPWFGEDRLIEVSAAFEQVRGAFSPAPSSWSEAS